MASSISGLSFAYWAARSTKGMRRAELSVIDGLEQAGGRQAIARAVGRAGQTLIQAVSRLAHPTDSPARIADDKSKVRHIADDHSSRADEAIAAERVSADDCCVRADGRAAIHQGRKE